MTIRKKLVGASIIVFILLILWSFFTIDKFSESNHRLQNIVDVSSKKINLSNEIMIALLDVTRHEKNIILEKDVVRKDYYKDRIYQAWATIDKKSIALQELLEEDGKLILAEFKKTWMGYKNDLNEIIRLAMKNETEKAFRISIDKGLKVRDESIILLSRLIEKNESSLQNDKTASETAYRTTFNNIIFLTITSILIVALLAYFIIQGINKRIYSITVEAQKIANRELTNQVAKDTTVNDELKLIFDSLVNIKESFNEVTQNANKVAAGNYTNCIVPRSDKDTLGHSLRKMTFSLQETTAANEKHKWLTTGQTQLNDKLIEVQNIEELTSGIIDFLCSYLKADIGAIYLLNDKTNALSLSGKYAFIAPEDTKHNFIFGEGLIGQAAKEQKQIMLSGISENQLRITSSLIDAKPKHLLITPFVFEGKTTGVIELGKLNNFSELEIEFINNSMESIAIMANSAIARKQIQDLLEETQLQSEELQSQQEELKQMNEDLEDHIHIQKENEQKLRSVIETAYNAIITLDKNLTIVEWNPSSEKMFGYTHEEIYGKPLSILFSEKHLPLYEKQAECLILLKTTNKEMIESEGLRKDGSDFPIEFSISSWTVEKNTFFTAFIRDISERKALESETKARQILQIAHQELMEAKELAENSRKLKEQFLANMSHEIRTPLNAIIGMMEILEDSKLNEEQKECADVIKISANNLLSVINDVLDFSKIESGKITFEKQPFVLEKLIEGIIQTLHFTVNKKSISLNYSISELVPPVILGDIVRLRQILLNLGSNAIKFTEQGSVGIDVQLKEQIDDNYTLLFTVTDTGIGISEDKLATIFESFVQASGDTTRKYGGTGLGLAITKQLIEIQGGVISVKSSPNRGSQFSFTLHFQKGEDLLLGTNENEEIISYTEIQGIRILLVEDNYMNQILAKKILNKWNLEYHVTNNGKEAIEKLSENDYDIILMDMHMPEMDGYEATKYIRNNMPFPKSNTPIIAITANAVAGEENKCLAAGMNDYISKPFNKKKLYHKILQLMKLKPAETNSNETCLKHEKHTDLTFLKELAEGSNEFMIGMINSFVTTTPKALNDMENAFAEKKWIELKIIAHTMKSTVDFMGIHSIKETIRTIEKYAETETNTGSLPELISTIKSACINAIEELKIEVENLS